MSQYKCPHILTLRANEVEASTLSDHKCSEVWTHDWKRQCHLVMKRTQRLYSQASSSKQKPTYGKFGLWKFDCTFVFLVLCFTSQDSATTTREQLNQQKNNWKKLTSRWDKIVEHISFVIGSLWSPNEESILWVLHTEKTAANNW